eukprot:scaffold1.g5381.t1
MAVLDHDLPKLAALLQHGSPREAFGLSALGAAALVDNAAAVPWLLLATADVNAPPFVADGGSYQLQAAVWHAGGKLGLSSTEESALQGNSCDVFSSAADAGAAPTPLALAVRSNATAVAGALLAAGASLEGTYTQLPFLAAYSCSTTQQGAAAAAVEAMAALLLERGLPQGLVAEEAHRAAAMLTNPVRYKWGPVHERCPSLYQRLKAMHASGALAAPVFGGSLAALLQHPKALRPDLPWYHWHFEDKSREFASWLEVPVAATTEAGTALVNTVLLPVIEWGGRAQLSALLRLPSVRAELRRQAADLESEDSTMVRALAHPEALPGCCGVGGTVTAAWDPLAELLAAGAHINIHVINRVLREEEALELLLSRAGGAGGLSVPPDPARFRQWPPFALLECQIDKSEAVNDKCEDYSDAEYYAAARAFHQGQLRLMEALVGASLRPLVYGCWILGPAGPAWHSSCPALDPPIAARWRLRTDNVWLWRAALSTPWSPATHASLFPPAFKATARALLLAAHRSSHRCGGSAAVVADAAQTAGAPGDAHPGELPALLIMRIIAAAAYPLSAWRPLPPALEDPE